MIVAIVGASERHDTSMVEECLKKLKSTDLIIRIRVTEERRPLTACDYAALEASNLLSCDCKGIKPLFKQKFMAKLQRLSVDEAERRISERQRAADKDLLSGADIVMVFPSVKQYTGKIKVKAIESMKVIIVPDISLTKEEPTSKVETEKVETKTDHSPT